MSTALSSGETVMAPLEIGLVARAKALKPRLIPREALELLAEATDLSGFARGLIRLGPAIDPIGERPDLFAIERAAERTVSRHLQKLRRWQTRTPGVLDVFDADRDRRSLRAVLRGAVQGAPFDARVAGVLPTPSLPFGALVELARQPTAAAVVNRLIVLRYPETPRLLPLTRSARPDLMALEVALLKGYADRATRAAAEGDETLREFVHDRIDSINLQNGLLMADGTRELDPGDAFVDGGRWLSRRDFVAAATAASQSAALASLRTAVAASPLASSLANGVGQIERDFLIARLNRLKRLSRLAPLGSAPLLRVLLRIEAQSHDLRALAWGAALELPPPVRKQQLVTPS